MSKWTEWRKIAEGSAWCNDEFDYDGPSCYELGIGGPNYGNIQPVYVGETGNEKVRLSVYARGGSHLSNFINEELRQGHSLYYHAQAMPSKEAAKRMQDNLLDKFKYPWNKQLNTDDED